MTRLLRRTVGLAFLVAGSFIVPNPAAAQQLPLGSVPGQNAVQQRMGTSINVVCLGLPTNGTAAQTDLLGRCTEMVLNANQLLGTGPTSGGDYNSLGLTSNGLDNAILQLSPNKGGAVAPNQTQVAFVQVANLKQRFAALRDGDTGFSVAGLKLDGTPLEHVDLSSFGQGVASGDTPQLPEGLGVFLTGEGDIGHFSGSDEVVGFNYYSWGVTGGVDYRFLEDFVAGLAFGWVGSRSDISGNGGDLQSDSFIPSLYASWTHDAWYADGIFSYARDNFDLSRNIVYPTVNRTATGDTNANEYSFSLGGGYEFDLKEVVEGLTAGPRVRFDYVDQLVDSFNEGGANGLNLSYRDYEIESAVSVVGFEAAYAVSTSFGVITPQMRFDWDHEFADQPERIKASFVADPNDVTFFVSSQLAGSRLLPGRCGPRGHLPARRLGLHRLGDGARLRQRPEQRHPARRSLRVSSGRAPRRGGPARRARHRPSSNDGRSSGTARSGLQAALRWRPRSRWAARFRRVPRAGGAGRCAAAGQAAVQDRETPRAERLRGASSRQTRRGCRPP